MIKLNCLTCGKEFERSPRIVRDKSKREVGGWFCGRSCAGKYSRNLQLGKSEKLPSPQSIDSEYYRNKNIQTIASQINDKYDLTTINS